MTPAAVRRANPFRLVVIPIAAAHGAATLGLAEGRARFTSYAGHSGLGAALVLITGLTLVVAGLVADSGRPVTLTGALTTVAGFLWLTSVWIGWVGGPTLIRSVGMLIEGFTFPVLVYVVLASPTRRVHSVVERSLIAAAFVETTLVALGLALFRDPFLDAACWNNCTDNVFLIHAGQSAARVIAATDRWFVIAFAATLVTLCASRLLHGSGAARRAQWPVALAGILLGIAAGAHAIALDLTPLEDPGKPEFWAVFVAQCAAVILLAAGLVWAKVRVGVQRRRVAGIVARLGGAPTPGSLAPALAQAMGDRLLEIAYWLPASRRYVDANGAQIAEPIAAPGRAVTTLARGGESVAVVTHSTGVTELEQAMGAGLRLALDNARLKAEVLTQLDDLRASRARIVETGDAERRRLERDLHDGAQQRILAVSYDIRVARARAAADGDTTTASLLAAATAESHSALEALRELAHGIFPAILTEDGLPSALITLAETAPVPVELGNVTEERYPPSVETAAYFVIAEGLADAATRAATHVTVEAVRLGDHLVITMNDDGAERTSQLVHLADRVGALNGSVDVEPASLRAQFPCV